MTQEFEDKRDSFFSHEEWWSNAIGGNVKSKNKLVEWKAFVDTVGIKCADLKNEFLL